MKPYAPILVVEDDVLDVKNIRRAFERNGLSSELSFVKDGELAMDHLRRAGEPGGPSRPGLILLDLNLPRMNGLEFLKSYKSDPAFSVIPTIVLTTSDERSDMETAYTHGAAGYILKPLSFDGFVEAMKRFDLYWSLCEVPKS